MTNSKLPVFVALTFGCYLGLMASQTSKSAAMSQLAEQAANPTKIDWILLNTRVAFLEKILRDQLAVPLVPTQWSFEGDSQQIRIAVYADPSWLAKRSAANRDEALKKRALELCVSPLIAGQFEYVGALMGSEKPPADFCAVRFWTHAMTESRELTTKDVALYEKGVLKPFVQ